MNTSKIEKAILAAMQKDVTAVKREALADGDAFITADGVTGFVLNEAETNLNLKKIPSAEMKSLIEAWESQMCEGNLLKKTENLIEADNNLGIYRELANDRGVFYVKEKAIELFDGEFTSYYASDVSNIVTVAQITPRGEKMVGVIAKLRTDNEI
nr:MAG TPA: hypothetical protein [Caudoviricetes sp.]